jgi:hypothetical protein
MRFSLVATFLLAQAVCAVGADDPQEAADLAAIAGLWERSVVTPDGRTFRILKDVKDGGETLTTVDQDGRILHAHTVDIRLKREGAIRVFLFSNRRITEGPDRGRRVAGSSGYAYRVRGDELVEVHGLLDIDDGEPGVVVWKRPKPRRST